MKNSKFLLATVFTSGMSIMAVEMSASRLLAPYFGTSLFVWTNIIGIIMVALSVGYYVGGRLSDKYPKEEVLYKIILAGGIITALIPFIANPIMKISIMGINQASISLFYTSLFATLLLFCVPLTLLGMVSPFAIRVSSESIKKIGNTAGSIYALSTVGSIIGTFIPALITIPFIGTRNTILLFASILIFISVIGIQKKRYFAILLIVLLVPLFTGAVKPTEGMIYETESIYHYIQVVEDDGVRYLKLNEGYAVHSKYKPDATLVGGVWDYFNLLPLINTDSEDALIIGLAAGTIPKEYSYFFPDIKVDGVEIDADVVEVGKKYFDMNDDNLKTYTMDGRIFLTTTEKKYDFIIIDAYRQPYIPFHLTTTEFFSLVNEHLNEGGLMAINVGSTGEDSQVLSMIQNTIKTVYDGVYVIKIKGSYNYIVIATDHEYDFNSLSAEGELIELMWFTEYFKKNYREIEFDDNEIILTDDKAPVEIFTDKMIFDYAVTN